MFKTILFALLLLLPGVSSAQFFFGDGKIIRTGSMIVYSASDVCLALNLDNVDRVIPEGASNPMEVLTKMFGSKRPLTDAERAVCDGDTVPTEPPVDAYLSEWSVASSDEGYRTVFRTNRRASGVLERIATDQQLTTGEPCASDAENTFKVWYGGGDLMWRYIPGSAELIVYCSRK